MFLMKSSYSRTEQTLSTDVLLSTTISTIFLNYVHAEECLIQSGADMANWQKLPLLILDRYIDLAILFYSV